jgi:hypothetical protein
MIGERVHALQHFDEGGFEAILGESAPIHALKARAAHVAPSMRRCLSRARLAPARS